jgi:CRP-like cAMP-binding protein
LNLALQAIKLYKGLKVLKVKTQLYSVENLLLRAAYRGKDPASIRKLKRIAFDAGHQFWPDDGQASEIIFPVRGVLSLQVVSGSGKQVEIGQVGREGLAGLAQLLKGDQPRMVPVALTPGEVLIMPVDTLSNLLRVPAFRAAVDRYLRLLLVMLSRISVCNRIHVIEKLCVSRLLLMQDLAQSATFPVTQDVFARHLGVRRASVSRVAAHLQKIGAIQYDRRGRLSILDRKLLEALACSCYLAIKTEFDGLVSPVDRG